MFATVLAAIVLRADQQNSLYRSIVKQPTGDNGYEEYLQAADAAVGSNVRALLEAVEAPNAPGSRLDRLRAIHRQCGRITPLVSQGNKKKVFYPNTMDWDTLLPELQIFRAIGSALVFKAEVDFADGRVNDGVGTLVDVMLFGDKVSLSGPVIHNLVGRAISRPALLSLSKNLTLVSLPAASEIDRVASAMLESESPWTRALTTEMTVLAEVLPKVIANPDELTKLGISEDEDIVGEIRRLTPARRKAVTDELVFAIRRHYEARLAMMQQPEREWPRRAESIKDVAVPADPVARLAFTTLVPDFGRVEMFEIVRRTQFRLLRLVAAIVTYKWTSGYFPGSLAVLPDQTVTLDPLTDKPFIYQRTQESFVVISEGTPDIPRIGLDG